MKLKKIGKALLFPHIAIMLVLIPIATALLVYSMAFVGTNTVIAYISYVLSAYTLTIWCFRIPKLISFFKNFKAENKIAKRWFSDAHLRVKLSLYVSVTQNAAYALFQLFLGIYHNTFWFYSLAGYYISLALMRFFLLRHVVKHNAGERMRSELIRYRACGIIFLVMNLALTTMIFFMVFWNRTFEHHEITTICMAAYTFTAFTFAILSIIKYRKYNSPVYSASKAISLAAALVSLLTLESTMLTTFGGDKMDAMTNKMLLGCSGGVISAAIIAMAVYMIVHSTKKIRSFKQKVEIYAKQS